MKNEILQNLPKLDDSDLSSISGGTDTAIDRDSMNKSSDGNTTQQKPSDPPPLLLTPSTLDIKVGSTIGCTGGEPVWITF